MITINTIILILYICITFFVLLIISITLPRITKIDKNKPIFYYGGFYIVNSIILNYFFKFNPLKTILENLILLLVAHLIGIRLRVMGLTGQICSGKSTVAKYLESKYKACVVDIDKLNRDVLEMNSVKRKIRKTFGDEVYNPKNELDKMKMRKIIYSDINKKRQLEKITHFEVFKLLIKTILKEKLLYGTQLVFIENAILLRFELLKYLCYPIIAVCTHHKVEIVRRIMNRDQCDKETAEKILDNQMKIEEFIEQSDCVIFNDGELNQLETEIDKILEKLM
jgi:dephospho-CoA kinase